MALTELPSGIFDTNLAATSFSNCFYYCNKLKTVPSGMFARNSLVTDFSSCFNACTSLVLASELFTDNTIGTDNRFAASGKINFTNCFSRGSYSYGTDTGSAPELWNCSFSTTPTTSGCFGGNGNSANSLSNYSQIPASWK